jgi:outer membrane protein TolC
MNLMKRMVMNKKWNGLWQSLQRRGLTLLLLLWLPLMSVGQGVTVGTFSQGVTETISLPEAYRQMMEHNRSVRRSRLQQQLASEERKAVVSTWFPTLLASGSALRLSNDLSVKLPDEHWLSSVMDKLGLGNFSFPLLDRQLTSTGVTLLWPLFTGGKRVYADRMARLGERMARVEGEQTETELLTNLVQTYYALRLSERVEAVRREAWQAMLRHEREALLMVTNGVMTKTEALAVKVALEESRRALLAAELNRQWCQQALEGVLEQDSPVKSEGNALPVGAAGETARTGETARAGGSAYGGRVISAKIITSSPLFIHRELLPVEVWKGRLTQGNYALSLLSLQEGVLQNQGKIARSNYWPEVVLFAQQTVYAHHIPKNLVPRTVLGIGFTWTLFDGGRREVAVRMAEERQTLLQVQRAQSVTDLNLLVEKLHNALRQSQEAMPSLRSTCRLCQELVRMRRKQFLEGMATSTEVVDAETQQSAAEVALLTNLYQYDVTLAQLFALCGQPDAFWQSAEQGWTDVQILETDKKEIDKKDETVDE